MHLIKYLSRIFKDYKFSILLLFFFEMYYFIQGYKGFKINLSKNDLMTDNIPCPYFFLSKIKKDLSGDSFSKLIDLGCGSGRIIDFFNNNYSNKKFVGIDFFEEQYNYCSKIFKNHENIEIIKSDFTKINLSKHESDCFFISAPFKNNQDFIEFLHKLINSSHKKKRLFIIINYDKNIIDNFKELKCIKSFYVGNRTGYSIYTDINT